MTKIRKVQQQDLASLTGLFDQYRVFYHYTSDKEQANQFLSQRLSQNDSVIYVAEQEGTLVGFVQLYPLLSSTRMKKMWLLNDLFMDKECRGQGISKQLIAAAQQLCRETGACGLSLETAKTNMIGNTLYPKTGFELDTDTNFYFWHNK